MSSKALRDAVNESKTKIEELVAQWTVYLGERRHIPADAEGQIRALLGMSSLLVKDKFKQFTGLLDQYDSGNAAGPEMLITDLQGFWDLLLIQVEDTFGKFKDLHGQEMANWKTPDVAGSQKSSPGPSTTPTRRLVKGDARKRLSKTKPEKPSNED